MNSTNCPNFNNMTSINLLQLCIITHMLNHPYPNCKIQTNTSTKSITNFTYSNSSIYNCTSICNYSNIITETIICMIINTETENDSTMSSIAAFGLGFGIWLFIMFVCFCIANSDNNSNDSFCCNCKCQTTTNNYIIDDNYITCAKCDTIDTECKNWCIKNTCCKLLINLTIYSKQNHQSSYV